MTKQTYKIIVINEYIQEMLNELQALSDDHFGKQAETKDWSDVHDMIEIGHRIRKALERAKEIYNK